MSIHEAVRALTVDNARLNRELVARTAERDATRATLGFAEQIASRSLDGKHSAVYTALDDLREVLGLIREVLTARAEAPPESREVWWLIERGQRSPQAPTLWWVEHEGWTENAAIAHRFATQQDAEAELSRRAGVREALGRATEHVFLGALSPLFPVCEHCCATPTCRTLSSCGLDVSREKREAYNAARAEAPAATPSPLLDIAQQPCAICGLRRDEHRLGYAASRCPFYESHAQIGGEAPAGREATPEHTTMLPDAVGMEWERITRAAWKIHSAAGWSAIEENAIEDFILTARHSISEIPPSEPAGAPTLTTTAFNESVVYAAPNTAADTCAICHLPFAIGEVRHYFGITMPAGYTKPGSGPMHERCVPAPTQETSE